MNSVKIFFSKHGMKILIGLLIIFVVANNWIWLKKDTGLGSTSDAADLIIKTISEVNKVKSTGWSLEILAELSRGGRPPLYQILSMPFICLLGPSMDSGLAINLVFQALLILLVYLTGKMVGNDMTGVLSAFFVVSYPPLIQISRLYMPHFALAACAALILWRAIALMQNRSPRNAWWFVLSVAFGVLIHPKIAGVILISVPVFSVYVVFFQNEPLAPGSIKELPKWLWDKLSDRIVWVGFLPAVILAAIPILAWYLTSGTSAFDKFETITSSELADFRGSDRYIIGLQNYPSILWYILTMPSALSNVLTLFFGAGLLNLVLKRGIAHIALLVSFLGAYVVYASYTTLAWMNFVPILPIVALISALWISEIKSKKVLSVLTSVAIVSSLTVFFIVNWGVNGVGIKIAQTLSSPVVEGENCSPSQMIFCPAPPDLTDWRYGEILTAIERDNDPHCSQSSKCDLLVIKRGYDVIPVHVRYYMWIQKAPVRSKLIIVQMAPPLWFIEPFDFNKLLNSEYIAYLTPLPKEDQEEMFFYDPIANVFLVSPPASFADAHQSIGVFDIRDGLKIHLIKRIKPLSLVEAEETIRAVNIDEKYKYQQYAVLAPLYAQSGQLDDSREAYMDALKYDPSDAELYFGLAGVYESLGRIQDATIAYQKVVELAPGTDLASQAQGWLSTH